MFYSFVEKIVFFRGVLFLLIWPYYRIHNPAQSLVEERFEGGQQGLGGLHAGLSAADRVKFADG